MNEAGAVIVVVPAHDEAATVGDCVRAIRRAEDELARTRPEIRVVLVVVADACTDTTAEIAAAAGAIVVRIDARSVGTARRIGTAVALELLGRSHPDDWIACTDADSVVPPGWLHEATRSRELGVDLAIGTVRPDFADLPSDYPALWRAEHPAGRPNGHVHGANLGIRRNAYVDAGGFSDQVTGEDVDLVARLRDRGAVEQHSDRAEVVTSARRTGRAPAGYAAYIAERIRLHAARAAVPCLGVSGCVGEERGDGVDGSSGARVAVDEANLLSSGRGSLPPGSIPDNPVRPPGRPAYRQTPYEKRDGRAR